ASVPPGLYPSDIIGVISHRHPVGYATPDGPPPSNASSARASRATDTLRALLLNSPMLGMEFVPPGGKGTPTRGERQRGGRRETDEAHREVAHVVAVGGGGGLAGVQHH